MIFPENIAAASSIKAMVRAKEARVERLSLGREDILAGTIFLAVGIAMIVFSSDLSIGSSFQPGSRYFPLAVGVLLSTSGAFVLLNDLIRRHSKAVQFPALRPFLIIVGIVLFGLTIERLGFIVSSTILTTSTYAAFGKIKIIELIAVSMALTVFCILVFVIGIGVRMPLLP
ncbi:tripartite tricarboxylate transporter TctB family protein [Devosia sp. A449]